MNTLQIYGLKRCATCTRALAWLQTQHLPHTFTDYRATPPTPAQLQHWQAQVGGWANLINRASLTWRNLPPERKSPPSDADWLALLAEYPTLVKRPVLVDGDKVTVGWSEKKYAEMFSR